MYSRDDETGWKQSTAFKKAFSIDVEIEFVGVWYASFLILMRQRNLASNARCRDTVSSVGIVPRSLPFTASSTSMRYFRHAISLDERRAKFKANCYHLQRLEDQKGTKPGEMPISTQWHWRLCHPTQPYPGRKDEVLSDKEHDDDNGPTMTDVLEVWFAGCHSGNSFCLNIIYMVPTLLCRHWRGISPEWHSEQFGKNSASLDDSPMLSC